jgi:thiosulfate/3-mercaptopyruvate sulfurtransferase
MKEISGKELAEISGDPHISIIDIRPADAYNGWILNGEKRGGHIPGSRSLPLKWTDYIDWIEIVRHKKILPDQKVVIYGYKPDEIEKVYNRFLKSGYENVEAYLHFTDEWSADPALPLESLKNFKYLVHPGWVLSLLEGGRPPLYDNNRFVIVHAHYRNRNAYLSGHIPRAIDMDTLALEAPETWNRRSPIELKKALEDHGITYDTTVVLYGKYMSPDNKDPFPGSAAGDIGAMRCAFIMMYAGVKDVRVLNGGFQSWQDAGLPISYVDEPRKPVSDFGINIPEKPWLAVDTPEAKEILRSPDSSLVCVRSRSEYLGEVSGYNYIEKKGRIPGALFADSGSDAYHMENYRNVDQTTREYREIEELWKGNGILPSRKLAFYCGTGWRGSEAFFNAWLMGYPRIAVYDGGWFEWSNDPLNPYETGEPEMQIVISNEDRYAG